MAFGESGFNQDLLFSYEPSAMSYEPKGGSYAHGRRVDFTGSGYDDVGGDGGVDRVLFQEG
jgi:hypothetical protein